MARRRKFALARRYGHASMKQVEEVTAGLKRIAKENSTATAVLLGAGVGAVAAGLGTGTAALVGAGAALAAEHMKK